MARSKFPGQRNSLDALVNRFEVGGYDRSFHGALKDANILADVFMHLTGGQSKFEFLSSQGDSSSEDSSAKKLINFDELPIAKISLTADDMKAHESRLKQIESDNKLTAIWNQS